MTHESHPTYLVQDAQGTLHAYWNREILRVDLAKNLLHDPPKAIYKRGRERLVLRYKRLIGRV